MSTTQDPGNGTHETTDAQAAELWPSGLREGYAEIGDVRLHYVEAGEGPLIVLLHGFPEFWYAWRQQIEPLVALPDASHWVHHDEAERVTQLLIDFFAPALPAK
jgi:pimeloyl-ACP methyl ester carboxylesterase